MTFLTIKLSGSLLKRSGWGSTLLTAFVCHKATAKGGGATSAPPWAKAARQGAWTCPITHGSDVHRQGRGRCLCSHAYTVQVTKKKMHLKMLVQNSKVVTETN